MALTNEQLTYSIEVKNNDINAKLSDSIEKAEMLDDAMEGLQNTVSRTSKIEEEYQKALQKSAETMAQNNEHIGRISQSTENLNRSFEQTTSIIDDLSDAISGVSMAVESLKKAYDIISDPRIIKAAQDLLTIFEAMAVVKGFDRLASSIETTRKKLETLAEAFDKFRNMVSGDIFQKIDQTADKSRLFLFVVDGLSAATKALAAGLATVAGFSIFTTISREGLNFGKILSDLGERFTGIFRYASDGFLNLVARIRATKISIADMHDAFTLLGAGGAVLGTINLLTGGLENLTAASLKASAGALAFGLVLKAAVIYVGSFIQEVGENLSNAMEVAQTKFAKTQQIVTQFGFVVKNFGAAYGEDFIGTLSEWEGQIERLANTTTFSSNELRKSAKLVIAENKALGLSYEENVKFLDRAVEIAASSGLDLFEVVQRLQSALVGNATAVAALGINLGSHALEHSELNKTIQKTVGTMTEQEKKQIALYEIYKQTEPLVGASIKQGQTIIGINQQLANSYEQIQSKLGSVNAFSMALSATYAEIVRNVSNLPDIFFDIVGTLGDVGGVILQVVGFTLKWILVITTLVTLYRIFNAIIITNIALQTKLTAVAQFLGLAFQFQATTVTTAAAALSILGKTLKGGILFIFSNVTAAITGATKAIASMTWALLANPLFLKAVAIVAAVSLFIKALDELNKELNYVEDTLAEFQDTFQTVKDTFTSIGKAMVTGFSAGVQVIKILILSIAELYQVAKIAYNALRKLWNPEHAQEYQTEIDASLNSLDNLAMSHTKALNQIASLWDKASGGGTAYAQTVDAASKKMDELAFRQDQMSKAATQVDVATIRIDILGTEVEKLTNRYSLAAKEVNRLSDEILNSAEINTEALKDYQTALEEQTQAAAQLDKLRIDTLKGIADLTKDVQKQTLKLTADETAQINQEFEDRKLAVLEFEKQLSRLGPVAGDSAKQIIDAYKSIETGRKAALKALQDKQDQEANDNYLKFLKEQNDLLDDIAKRNRELQMEALGDSLTERQKINEMLKFDTEELEKQIDHYKTQWGAQSAVVQGLEKQKKLTEDLAKAKIDQGPGEQYERLEQVGTDTSKQISSVFSSGALQMVGGAASMVGMIVKVVDMVLDMIPNMINSLTGVFNKLTDFPETLFKAFQGMFDAIVRFVGEFIPKLVESIFKSMTQIKDFVNNLANALDGLAEQLPDIISNLIEKFPEMAISLAENLAKAYLKILAAIYVKIPFGIMKGIFAGLSKLWEGIKRLMAGKSFMPKVKMDEKSITEAVKKLGGSAGRLFSVKDMLDAAKDPLDKVTDGIQNAFKKGADWIKEAWMWVYEKTIKPIFDGLKQVWMWVYEKIVLPIGMLIKDAWTWVDENILKPIISAFMDVFNFLGEKVFKPAVSAIKAVYTWINENVLKPAVESIKAVFLFVNDNVMKPAIAAFKAVFEFLSENVFKPAIMALKSLFSWLNDTIFKPFTDAIYTVFSWIKDKVLDPLAAVGEKIAKPITDAFHGIMGLFNGLGEALKSLFKLDISGVKEALQGVFEKGGEILQNAFKGIVNPIIRMFNGIIDVFNGMVIPGVRWSVSAGKLGSWSGQLWDDIDLIPGDISKLQTLATGGLVLPSSGVTLQGLGSDTVPIAATPGEFIVNRRGVETAGLDMLSMINRGVSPQSSGTYNLSFEINIDAKQPMDEGFIRGKLVPAMRDELKRASLDGQFVLSSRGIR